MQPDFATLKPISNQPDFATLKPVPLTPPTNSGGLLGAFAANPTVQSIARNVNTDINKVIGDTATKLQGNIKTADTASRNPDGSINPIKATAANLAQAAVGVVNVGAGIAGAAGASVSDLVSPFIPQGVKDKTSDFFKQIQEGWSTRPDPNVDPEGARIYDKVHTAATKVNTAVQQNPEVANTVKDAVELVLAAQGLEGGVNLLKGGVQKGLDVAPKVLSTADSAMNATTGGIKDFTMNLKNKVIKPSVNELQSIADTISPKMGVKEARLAESQGRLIKGNEPTLFKSGTPDQVLTSDKVYEATQTIFKEIPNASKMSEPDLYVALEGRTTDMAKTLKPQMQKVFVKPEVVKNTNSIWKDLKKSQIDVADATEEANVLKLQSQFESRLKTIKPTSTLDDIWTERIAYDNSIPANVKNANSLSDSRLQLKKEIWLQNRDIFNSIINDAESGLGETSRGAFKDMSNMYNAKANLLSKAEIDLKVEQSKVVQWMKNHPYIMEVLRVGGISTGFTKLLTK